MMIERLEGPSGASVRSRRMAVCQTLAWFVVVWFGSCGQREKVRAFEWVIILDYHDEGGGGIRGKGFRVRVGKVGKGEVC